MLRLKLTGLHGSHVICKLGDHVAELFCEGLPASHIRSFCLMITLPDSLAAGAIFKYCICAVSDNFLLGAQLKYRLPVGVTCAWRFDP